MEEEHARGCPFDTKELSAHSKQFYGKKAGEPYTLVWALV
jgi:hypothetical protein